MSMYLKCFWQASNVRALPCTNGYSIQNTEYNLSIYTTWGGGGGGGGGYRGSLWAGSSTLSGRTLKGDNQVASDGERFTTIITLDYHQIMLATSLYYYKLHLHRELEVPIPT